LAQSPRSVAIMSEILAPYASWPEESRGRLHPEPESETRSIFQRDRDRIIHSTAFRRLMHKTQVFVSTEGDHYRTRLTHSIEVSQIARGLSRGLSLNEDLAEALALAHDFGHTPFGHTGEDALNGVMEPFGGFDHNDQTLRILVKLERRYAEFDGLNLSWETIEGIAKHNGPVLSCVPNAVDMDQSAALEELPLTLREYNKINDLELHSFAGPEAQAAALADDIAYNNHDIDDGLRAGLFTIDDLREVPHVAEAIDVVRKRYPDLERTRLIHEVVRRLINGMVTDVLDESRRRIANLDPQSVKDIRAAKSAVVAFSPVMSEAEKCLKAFLFKHLYRHESVARMRKVAHQVVVELFERMLGQPSDMPLEWRGAASAPNTKATARIVADYIAGMTDRYAFNEHNRLFKTNILEK
jgi:dGTPase